MQLHCIYQPSLNLLSASIMSILQLLLSGTILLSLQASASPLNQSSIISRLQSLAGGFSPETQIFYPSDADWLTETTQRYTVHDAPTYIASIKPAKESDVQKIVSGTITLVLYSCLTTSRVGQVCFSSWRAVPSHWWRPWLRNDIWRAREWPGTRPWLLPWCYCKCSYQYDDDWRCCHFSGYL